MIRTPAVGQEARQAKAAKVEEEGLVFVEKYVASNKATTHLYMHILTSHLPQMIRDLPVDPVLFSTSGLEHGHKQRKAFAALMCMIGPHVEGTTKNVWHYIYTRRASCRLLSATGLWGLTSAVAA